MIERALKKRIEGRMQPRKAILLFGARRVGKTVLLKQIDKSFHGRSLFLNGEDVDAVQLLESGSVSNYKRLVETIGLLIIDEAHPIPQIGNKLKLIVDEIENLIVIASGSSLFDLLNKAGDPLWAEVSGSRFIRFPRRKCLHLKICWKRKEIWKIGCFKAPDKTLHNSATFASPVKVFFCKFYRRAVRECTGMQ